MKRVQRGCECQDCSIMSRCGRSNAPVIKLVERKGKQIKVCSRCDLTSDKLIKYLVTAEHPFRPYFDYDPLVIAIADKFPKKTKDRNCSP